MKESIDIKRINNHIDMVDDELRELRRAESLLRSIELQSSLIGDADSIIKINSIHNLIKKQMEYFNNREDFLNDLIVQSINLKNKVSDLLDSSVDKIRHLK